METNQKEYLAQVCRLRCRVAKAEAAAIGAKRKSEIGPLLERMYSPAKDDSPWGKLNKFADSAAAKANEEIARLAEEFGTHLMLGPTLTISYGQWPEIVQFGSENDWQVAVRKIRRLETEAAAQIERTSMDSLIQVMDEYLAPAEA